MEQPVKHPPVVEAPSGETRILLHACCAPCSSAIIECLLYNGITPVIYYSNSNIFPLEEYLIRKNECTRHARALGLEIVDDDYDHEDWRRIAEHLEKEPERGRRCLECFKYRLTRAAGYACRHGLHVLATTLASSRWKDLSQIDAAGEFACSLFPGVSWWSMNWRKGGLQERRNQLIKQYSFYNQPYCGCEFSFKNKQEK